MQGKRVYEGEDVHVLDQLHEPGAYGKYDGEWYATTPNGLRGGLASHDVVEHEDGTITVTPSILCEGGPEHLKWHGWLTRGVWREC